MGTDPDDEEALPVFDAAHYPNGVNSNFMQDEGTLQGTYAGESL